MQVKTQQGVPSQPSNLRAVESRATSITLAWEQPSHSGDNIVSYELYWNDTFSGDVCNHVFLKTEFLFSFAKGLVKVASSVYNV